MVSPFFTVIITLTERLSYLFPFTLDSLIAQQGSSSFEVIIIDGTKEGIVVNHVPHVKVVPAISSNHFDMVNQALKLAQGQYIHCLSPGEFYMTKKTLQFATKIIHAYDFPDLMYSAWMVRHSFGQPTVDIHPLLIDDLKKARMPVNLQPFWFRKETLLMLGGFSKKYKIQGGYDLICRYFQAPTLRKAFVRRVLTDYEYRKSPSKWILHQCLEIFCISFLHFGPSRHLFLWLIQNCLRLFRFSWKLVRIAFWKRHAAY